MRQKKARYSKLKLALLIFSLANLSSPAAAGEKVENIINKAVKAYGGDKLLRLKNLRYNDTIEQFFSHQSGHSLQGPTTSHLNQIQLEVNLDFEHQRAELKRATRLLVGYHEDKNLTTTHRVFSEEKGYNLDHCLAEYQPSEHINFSNADLGYSQMLDPLIVKKLAQDSSNIQWTDTAYIQGEAHDVITINQGTPTEYSVYINRQTGLLSRMLQQRGAKLRTYNFLNHQTSEDIVWAKQMFVGTEDQPIYHTDQRELRVNSDNGFSFNMPTSYQASKAKQPFDVSKLTVRELANGVYFVGQDWGYTLFIDVGEHYISAGAWGMSERSDDWKKALNLLHKTTGNNKPVKQHLVSHHHTDHMSELHDVLDHGANLLIHPTDIKAVRNFLKGREIADSQFSPIDKTTTLANGEVMIYDVPSSQANHNLVIYLPKQKIIFSEDVFGSSFQQQHHSPRAWPHMDTYQRLKRFTKQIKKQGLEVEQYLSSHHGRVLTQQDVDKALTINCPSDKEYLNRLFSN